MSIGIIIHVTQTDSDYAKYTVEKENIQYLFENNNNIYDLKKAIYETSKLAPKELAIFKRYV